MSKRSDSVPRPQRRHRSRGSTRLGQMLAATSLAGLAIWAAPAQAQVECSKTYLAEVVALDQPVMFNRLGAQNINWMMYALKEDVVDANNIPLTMDGSNPQPGQVKLRADKRPRPLVLRVPAGTCLRVRLTNMLAPAANPNNAPIPGTPPFNLQIDDQVADRHVGFHSSGMQLVNRIQDDGSMVGNNPGVAGSLVPVGSTRTYTLLAEKEGAFEVTSHGAQFGADASAGNTTNGLFGEVIVEPAGSVVYRSVITEEELRLVTRLDRNGNPRRTPDGQPVINYEARYPTEEPWISEGKANRKILNMMQGTRIVHTEIDAVVAYGPEGTISGDGTFPPETYPLESVGKRNPTYPTRLQPFRDFASVFHDENAASQAFPEWFLDPVLSHTLHGVRDSFMINYGSGGIGTEIIANRLGVGPMHDCLGCAYEEFFLTSFTVGDPASLVDVPANFGLEGCTPALVGCEDVGPKANEVLYPNDPSNVHHSYVNDAVKFRNIHVGKEQHVFHLHNHQWLFNPSDDNSNYIDAQGIGPGSGYTYEIAFGGSGNRNKSAGDAIFHCHFYPHFAQGMWYMWRVHDVFEPGSRLAVSGDDFHSSPFALQSGKPAAGARAYPDGEIVAGTPIPAVVPLPGKAMAPMPGEVTVVPKVADNGVTVGSNAKVVDRDVNPGYPFWVAGIEDSVGQRPPTPPLDMATKALMTQLKGSGDPLWAKVDATGTAEGFDGGLPRFTTQGFADGGAAVATQSRLDLSKVLVKAKPVYFPEEGTDLEQLAMRFMAQRAHPSYSVNGSGQVSKADFVVNGLPPVAGAPYADPCVDDGGQRLNTGVVGNFFGAVGLTTQGASPFNADTPRVYKAGNVQIDAVFNKVGYHYPQQRIISLWEDVNPFINKEKAPEPFVIRMNTFDCTMYAHSNFVPAEFEVDDYQVRTPTDIIGQHIHLPKWDLTTADGAANGWNYEDGTLSPGAVRERIEAINHFNEEREAAGLEPIGPHLEPEPHPFLGAGVRNEWLGARVTLQRWFADPVVNTEGVDRGLGIIFTHDHYGPSTHQQIGLYATVLTEPAGSKWVHNESGETLYTRDDGGPTSWQVAILPGELGGYTQNVGANDLDAFREFYFEYSDFQHAYQKGVYVGAGPDGRPHTTAGADGVGHPVRDAAGINTAFPVTANTFRDSINPSFRQEEPLPDIVGHPAFCPGGVPRPCPEAITADDSGMLVVNYRNEPVGLRVYDPDQEGPDGKKGSQAEGRRGDLAFALQSRTDRRVEQMNTRLGDTPYPALNRDIDPGDPFTPMMRSYSGDLVKVKIQAGGHEHEHNTTIHGVKWLQAGSGHGKAPNSGWRNAQSVGISEQFTLSTPVFADFQQQGEMADYLWSVDASQDGFWTGMWGLLRNYTALRGDLPPLPSNPKPVVAGNRDDFDGVCPKSAPVRRFDVTAVLANNVLRNSLGVTIPENKDPVDNVGGRLDPEGGTLVYNPRDTEIRSLTVQLDNGEILQIAGNRGPLHDPTGVMFVRTADLNQEGKLKSSAPVEPLVLRANAGDCLYVTLRNELHDEMPDLAGYNTLLQVVRRDRGTRGGALTWFENNLIRPSSEMGLHPQLVEYDVTRSDGVNVGQNRVQTVGRGDSATYQWYAGHLELGNNRQPLSAAVSQELEAQEDKILNDDRIDDDVVAEGEIANTTTTESYAGDYKFGDYDTATREQIIADAEAQYEAEGPDDGDTRDDDPDVVATAETTDMADVIATPVEFGGANLSPADRIKQGQKGMVGGLVIEPIGADWADQNVLANLDQTIDHQVDTTGLATPPTRATRAQATITNGEAAFRDFVTMHQKALNLRFADGAPVPNLSAEGQAIPEDSHDAGQMAVNYGTEPAWFRFGLPAQSPFGKQGFGGVENAHELFSNQCCTNGGTATTATNNVGEPATPVFVAAAGQEVRMRVLEPTGAGRGTTFGVHGHLWARDPYFCPGEARNGLVGACEMNTVASRAIGVNPQSFLFLGAQESIMPMAHFDLFLPKAGGQGAIAGDYLFVDRAAFGRNNGLWGLMRVQ